MFFSCFSIFCISSSLLFFFFFFNDTATTEIYTLSLHDALPISLQGSLEQLREFAGQTGDDFLRVIVEEPGRAGLAETVQDLLGPGVVEVRLESISAPGSDDPGQRRARLAGQTPHE